MILRTPAFYKDFKCIAGDCPDSCCQGWEVDADKDSLNYYKTLSGDIKNRIDSVLDNDEFGNTIFRLTDKKRCPFLNDSNLCDMHIAIGGEHTPYTCRTFPRFINNYGSTREMGVSFSCPVAADMMFNLEGHMTFCDKNEDFELSLNEIDAQTYFYLVNARKTAFEIMQNSEFTVKERLLQLLDFSVEIQQDLGGLAEPNKEIDFTEIFKNPEVINPEWIDKVDNFTVKPVANEPFNEHIACYFIFRYFLEAVYDYDVVSKIKMAVIGVLIATYFGEDSWTIHLWSKETEHSQYNMDRYKELLKTAKCLSVSSLKKMIET